MMSDGGMIHTIFGYFIIFCFINNNSLVTGTHFNLLLIGDSVDRYLVSDYCKARNANYCATIQDFGGKYTITNCTTKGSYPLPLSGLFSFTKRIFPWSVVFCEDFKEGVTVGFLFNTQGVSPCPPWFWPAKSMCGLENKNFDDYNVEQTFDIAQGPAVVPLRQAFGGEIHALLLNSVFWDIGRLVMGELGRLGGKEICNDSVKRAQFVSSWASNASHLITTALKYFPQLKWKGWRTANYISNPTPPCRNLLVSEMNIASHVMAEKTNLKWLDFSLFPGVSDEMRDSHHPNANVTAHFLHRIVRHLKHAEV